MAYLIAVLFVPVLGRWALGPGSAVLQSVGVMLGHASAREDYWLSDRLRVLYCVNTEAW